MAENDGYRDDYFALLIGNGTFPEGPDRLADLRGPVNDVRALKEALTDRDVGYFRSENVETCTDSDAEEIKEVLASLVTRVPRQSHFLLYYSGHGIALNKHLRLATRRSTKLGHTCLSMGDLKEILGGLKAEQQTLILDCCYAGLAPDKSADSPVDTLLRSEWRGEGSTLLRASDIETAKDARSKDEPSPFTKALIEGLFKASAMGTNPFVDLSSVYDDYMTVKLEEWEVPLGNVSRRGVRIPIARRVPAVASVPPPTGRALRVKLPEELDDEDVVEQDMSDVTLEDAVDHLAALVELGERLSPQTSRVEAGERVTDPDQGVLSGARAFLHERLGAAVESVEAPYLSLRRVRMRVGDSVAGLPWEHLPHGADRPIGLTLGLVVERSVGRRFPAAGESTSREKVGYLGSFSAVDKASAVAGQVVEQAVAELGELDVEPRRWRPINIGIAPKLPPYLWLLPIPRRTPRSDGYTLEVNIDGDWIEAPTLVKRLADMQRRLETGPRLVVVETIAGGSSRDASRATAELAHLLASEGLGHVAFVCHPRSFDGYPDNPEEPDDARTFAAYLIRGLDSGQEVHRAFHTAVLAMTLRFRSPADEFGVPGLYVTEREEHTGAKPAANEPPRLPATEEGGDDDALRGAGSVGHAGRTGTPPEFESTHSRSTSPPRPGRGGPPPAPGAEAQSGELWAEQEGRE